MILLSRRFLPGPSAEKYSMVSARNYALDWFVRYLPRPGITDDDTTTSHFAVDIFALVNSDEKY